MAALQIILAGGAQFDVSPLAHVMTLEEISFEGSKALGSIQPLAALRSLKKIDVTECGDPAGRTEFGPSVTILPAPR